MTGAIRGSLREKDIKTVFLFVILNMTILKILSFLQL